MGLPVVALPHATVEVGGQEVKVRGLARAEAMQLARYQGDPDAAEDYVLSCGVDVPVEEVHAWRLSTPSDVVDVLLDTVLELSGLTGAAQKSDREAGGDG